MIYPASKVIRAVFGLEGIVILPTVSGVWPCYISHLPDGDAVKNDALCLIDHTGIKQGRLMAGEVVERAGVQCLLRSLKYLSGWQKVNEIVEELDQIVRLGIDTGNYFYFIEAVRRGTVIPLGLEEGSKRRSLFSLNMDFHIIEEGPYDTWGDEEEVLYKSRFHFNELIHASAYFGEGI